MIRPALFVIVGAAWFVGSCSSSQDAGRDAASNTTVSPAKTQDTVGPTVPDTVDPTTPTDVLTPPDETFAPVRTTVVGNAVGGASGGVLPDGSDSRSELLRQADGTCIGWEGPNEGAWTQGLESGAPAVFLDAKDGNQIGTGTLGTSRWFDADPDNLENQWVCEFPFAGEVEGNPVEFWLRVGDLNSWKATRDLTRPGEWVVSVDSKKFISEFSTCGQGGFDEVTEWFAVGQFWVDGFNSICSNGAEVTDATIRSICRPPNIGSDRIVKVTSNSDPEVVYEDSNGFHVVLPGGLEPGTEVRVYVATGRPCQP